MLINNQRIPWEALIVLIIGILLRFLYLDADPHYYGWNGYVTDEGRWNESARSLVHYGSLFTHDGSLHLMLSPLFQFTNYLFYLFFDISRLTSRLFPAICGSLMLVLFYLRFRSRVTPQALLLGITLLAFQTDLVVLSRISIPEITVMLFQLLIFFTIITKKYSPFNMVIAGGLMLIAIGMKATVLPFLVIFSVVILTIPSKPLFDKACFGKLLNLLLFWAGFTFPVFLIGAPILFYDYLFCDLSNLHFIYHLTSIIERFIGVPGHYFYNFVSFPFEHPISTTFNIWALGLWITVLSWTGTNKDDGIRCRYNRIIVASFTWFILYFVMMQSLRYFPERYKVHILIPMAVIITAGISLFQQVGIIKVVESFTKGKPRSQVFRIFILTFPTSVFISPLIIFLLTQVFTNSDRLLCKISCMTILSFIITIFVYNYRLEKKIICFLLIFPIIIGVGWQILQTVSAVNYHFWINSGAPNQAVNWTLILLLASIISVVLVSIIYQLSFSFLNRIITLASIFYLTISLVKIYPGYLNPQYSIKNTSIKIGILLADSSSVASNSADGLFMDNSIPYRWFNKYTWESDMPEIIVVAFRFKGDKDFLERNYRSVQKYKLYFSPEYLFTYPHTNSEVTVYKRIKSKFSGKKL